MNKRILAFFLCMLTVISMGIMGVSAEDVVTGEQILYVDMKSGDLDLDTTKVYCHIWEYGGDPLASWQTKKELCTLIDSTDGLWKYNITSKGLKLENGVTYCVIFSTFEGVESYDLLMDTTCLGDTACNKGEGVSVEAPNDSTRKLTSLSWKNSDSTKYGQVKAVTELGNVIGECFAPEENEETLYKSFIESGRYLKAAMYTGRTNEEQLKYTADLLGINEDRAYELELEAGLHKPVTKDEIPTDPIETTTIEEEPVESTVAETTTVETLPTETTPDEAIPEDTEPVETEPTETTPDELTYKRYYFYMPEYWANEYSSTVGIYWWEGTDACTSWPGYEAKKADAEGVYYYDVPSDVEAIIWNNFVDGGSDQEQDIYYGSYQTMNIYPGYDPDENDMYPEGIESCDGMIFVVCDDVITTGHFPENDNYVRNGVWYYYYGNGEYGTAKNKEDAEKVFTDSYLSEAGIEAPKYEIGDVNLDGKLNIKDATTIQKYSAKLIRLGGKEKFVADYNGDGNINVKDATQIQKKIAGLI